MPYGSLCALVSGEADGRGAGARLAVAEQPSTAPPPTDTEHRSRVHVDGVCSKGGEGGDAGAKMAEEKAPNKTDSMVVALCTRMQQPQYEAQVGTVGGAASGSDGNGDNGECLGDAV